MMGRDMRAMDPLELIFWAVMSLGVMVGFPTAYPSNVRMVKKKIKHGLMTERDEGGQGSPRAYEGHGEAQAPSAVGGHAGHGAGQQMGSDATAPQLAALAGVTSFLLISGMVLPGFSVNLRLSLRDVDASIMPPGMIKRSTFRAKP